MIVAGIETALGVADAPAALADGKAKMCIHLRQVPLAGQVFTPTPDEVARAREVVAAGEPGVGVVDGQMAGDMHVRMARAVLARAEPARAEPSSGERPS